MEAGLARFHHGGVLEPVTQAEGAVVVEIITQIHVRWRRLFGDGLERRVRLDHRHGRQPAAVGNSQHAHASVVVRNVLEQPVDGVVGVGALVDGLRVVRVAGPAQHHELAFGFVTPANILEDEDVTFRNQLAVVLELGGDSFLVVRHPVGRALENERQRLRSVLGRVDFRVQVHAVTHGNHDVEFLEDLAEIRRVLAARRPPHIKGNTGGEGEHEHDL